MFDDKNSALPRRLGTELPERRVSAFLYGNILVLSALLVLTPDSLQTPRAIVSVTGVGLSTYVAHVAADVIAHLLRHPGGEGLSTRLPGELRDALPIASSALLPTIVLVAAWFGWLENGIAWALSIGVMLVRLSLLGPIAAWVAREAISLWPFLAGVLLSLLIAIIAVMKAMLTH